MIRAITVRRLASASILVTAAAGLTVSLTPAPLPPVADRQEIRPGLIGPTSTAFAPSAQAGAITIEPATIASGSTVLAPAVSVGAVRIAPAAIPSAASAYPPAVRLVDPQAATIAPERIEPTSIVFEPVVSPGAATLAVPVIASSATVATPVVSSGPATIAPDHIASAASVPPPSVAPGTVIIVPQPIASMASVFVPDVRPGAVTLALPAIASTASARAPLVQPGAVSISAPTIAPTAAVFAPTVSVPASGYDADAQAYFNAMTVQPSDTRKGQIDTLVKGLKTDGVWVKLDWLCLLAAHDAQAGRLNARNPAKALRTENNPVFTIDRGYQGDGSTAFLDFGEPFGFSGAKFLQDDASVTVSANATGPSTARAPQIGNIGAPRTSINVAGTDGNNTYGINSSAVDAYAGSGISSGIRTAVRASAAETSAYTNGSLIATAQRASSSVSTTNGCLLRTASAYSDDRVSACASGASLSAAQVQALHNRLNTYLNAIGAA